MKIVVIGGHLTPALAVIEKLSKNDEVVYIGRKHSLSSDSAISLEYETIQKLGIRFISITSGKLQRVGGVSLREASKIPIGFSQALSVLYKTKPDVVLSFGSYVSVPVVLAAWTLRIPIVLHEQTQDAGLANRIAAPFASKICISFEGSRKYFPKSKTILTGIPIRDSIKNSKKTSLTTFTEDLPLVFVTGGSQGSHKVNELVYSSLERLITYANILHQTGDSKYKDYESLQQKKKDLGEFSNRYKAFKFLNPDEMGESLNFSTLIVGRAGANTVSELLYLGKPSILIPLSFSQRQEQAKNAFLLKEAGIAEILNESVGPMEFSEKISSVLKNIDKYKINRKTEQKKSQEAIISILKNAANKK